MRLALMVCATLLLAGCTAGPSEPLPPPDLLVPEQASPAPGIEWTNLSGPVSPGSCHSLDARLSPPSVFAWWLASDEPMHVRVANWTPHYAFDTLCSRTPDPALSRENVTDARDERRILDEHDGYEIALACPGPAPCDVRFSWQRVQGRYDNGTLVWAGEVGPSPRT